MNVIASDVEWLLPLLPKVSPLLPKIAGGRSDFSLNFDSSLSPECFRKRRQVQMQFCRPSTYSFNNNHKISYSLQSLLYWRCRQDSVKKLRSPRNAKGLKSKVGRSVVISRFRPLPTALLLG